MVAKTRPKTEIRYAPEPRKKHAYMYRSSGIINNDKQHLMRIRIRKRAPFEVDRRLAFQRNTPCYGVIGPKIRVHRMVHVIPDRSMRYLTAQDNHSKRQQVYGNEKFEPPNNQELVQVAEVQINRMAEFTSYLENGEVDVAAGKRIMREKLKRSSDDDKAEASKKISEIKKNAEKSHIIAPEETRHEIQVNKTTSVFVNQSDLKNLNHVEASAFYRQTDHNIKDFEKFSPNYSDAQKKLQKKSIKCKCQDKCGDDCVCRTTRSAYYKKSNVDAKKEIYFSCSEDCACMGKCNNSIPEPPPNGYECVVHPLKEKGIAVRSTQYSGFGEVALTMTGDLCPEYVIKLDDPFSIKTFEAKNGGKAIKAAVAKLTKDGKFAVYSKEYEKLLNVACKQNLFINPRENGNAGRSLAHSCLGNLKPNIVLRNGLNPANAEVVFSTVMKIFPDLELNFFYSHEYACGQLADICLCGELCCIRNVAIFPFIKKEDIMEYYRGLYETLVANYKKNVIVPLQKNAGTRIAKKKSRQVHHTRQLGKIHNTRSTRQCLN